MTRVGIPDAKQRARALETGASFIVQAPAGSGKTELLIQRYLALLAQVGLPEEIAAITFTIKAAAEMRMRVLEALDDARCAPRPEAEHAALTWDLARAVLERNAALGWRLEENAVRLRVQTIDALCASLTRQMPVVARFGAQPQVVEDATDLYAQAARETLALVRHGGEAEAADVARFLEYVDNDAARAAQLLATLLAQRDHWLRTVLRDGGDRAALERAFAHERRSAIERARALFPPGCALPRPEDAAGWSALPNALLTQEGKWRKDAPPGMQTQELRAALRRLRELPLEPLADEQWEMLGAFVRLSRLAVAKLKLVFAARGVADFVEIAQGAVRALQGEDGPTDLLLALDYRIRHLLVDEFQDTSFTQFQLLEHLTSGWEPGDGRTLFLVGDPMQSIYRFREAEVALFLRARQEGIGDVRLEPLTLSANFRSQAAIVEWVNEAFAQVMPAAEDVDTGAVAYSESVAVHPREAQGVTLHALASGDREGEARRVVELVRAGEGGTTGILVRNREHLAVIVPHLRRAGLRFRAIEIESLANRPVVQDLFALARALMHAADRPAWLAVLRAPWSGLTLADLLALAGGDRDRTVWELVSDADTERGLSDDGRLRLDRVRATLAPFVGRRSRASLRDAVEGAWLALGGPACVDSRNDLEDAEIFLDHLEEAEEAGGVGNLEAFERGLARLFAQPDLAASDAVEVMTIHRAKGLEFDTVIVPGLASGTGQDDRRLFMWMETRAGLLLAPMSPAGGDANAAYEYIRALDKEKADHELGRLLYVAATRARRRLHLLGECKRDRNGEVAAPPRGSLLRKLWPAVAERFAPPAAAVAMPAERSAAAAEASTRLVRLRAMPAVAPPPAVPWQATAPAARRDAIEFSWVGETARHVGSVVHRWLQRMADDELRGWSAKRVRELRLPIRQALAARGIAPEELAAAEERSVAALTACLADPRGRWVLGRQRAARNEYRITALVAGERRQLVIDRMFVDADGRHWIVDYKTSAHEGAGVEAFLAQEQKRYSAQLERYATVLLPAAPAMLGLYFPLLKGWREWAHPHPAALSTTP